MNAQWGEIFYEGIFLIFSTAAFSRDIFEAFILQLVLQTDVILFS
jgi:hypothetical protein